MFRMTELLLRQLFQTELVYQRLAGCEPFHEGVAGTYAAVVELVSGSKDS